MHSIVIMNTLINEKKAQIGVFIEKDFLNKLLFKIVQIEFDLVWLKLSLYTIQLCCQYFDNPAFYDYYKKLCIFDAFAELQYKFQREFDIHELMASIIITIHENDNEGGVFDQLLNQKQLCNQILDLSIGKNASLSKLYQDLLDQCFENN